MNKGIKFMIIIIIALVFVGCGAFVAINYNKVNINFAGEQTTEKDIISADTVKNYNIYYGYEFTDEIIEGMCKYDLVVLEPLNVTDEKIIKKLKKQGVKVYGYMSFAEVSPFDKEMLSKVRTSDYLLINDNRISNFGCDIADIRSEHVKDLLMQVVQTRIIDGGYDGLFIDTLDDYEFISILETEELVDEMTSEVAELLKRLNEEYPDLNVILNRAFTGLEKCEELYVDAVLFESMSALEGDEYYDNMVAKVDNFTSQGGVCLSLSNSPEQESIGIQCANKKGWIHYYRPDAEYTNWYEYFNE